MQSGYRQFCPVAMASEILGSRWTLVLLRELVCGSTRFNDLRRGVPRMSPALLAKRLKELEKAGIVVRRRARAAGMHEYQLTAAGKELGAVIERVGSWGQRWIDANLALENLDPTLLMWDMRRNLDPRPFPRRRCVVQFIYPELRPPRRNFWLVIEPGGEVDLCLVDPGFDVDLYVTTDVRTMTAIWLGLARLPTEIAARRVSLSGERALAADMERWLGYSRFAREPKVGRLRFDARAA